MKKILLTLAALLLVACAADPAKVRQVGFEESARLLPPEKPFSTWARFDLVDMQYSDGVKEDAGKLEEATEFRAAYDSVISPLINGWNRNPAPGSDGTLRIESEIVGLRVISGGARFWAGAFAGDSFIDVDMTFIDEASGATVAKVRINRSADSMTGAWSIGKSDQNLDQYIVSIAENYLLNNY